MASTLHHLFHHHHHHLPLPLPLPLSYGSPPHLARRSPPTTSSSSSSLRQSHPHLHPRRSILVASFAAFVSALQSGSSSGSSSSSRVQQIDQLVQQAVEAWEDGLDPSNSQRVGRLNRASEIFDRIVLLDPDHTEWLEARGQVLVDAKRFRDALADFDEVIRRNPDNFKAYSGRALAHEGLAEWEDAVDDYTKALQKGKALTGYAEPYVTNSRGNAFSSLGRYSDALQDYLASVQGFQKAKQLDGAIYAASNAALMHIQLGDEEKGMRELSAVARRAPASIDMRAALAALYWSQGKEQAAEDEWQFACENINSGQLFDSCALYKDQDWLRRIRRWPPVMVKRMDNFLRLISLKN